MSDEPCKFFAYTVLVLHLLYPRPTKLEGGYTGFTLFVTSSQIQWGVLQLIYSYIQGGPIIMRSLFT